MTPEQADYLANWLRRIHEMPQTCEGMPQFDDDGQAIPGTEGPRRVMSLRTREGLRQQIGQHAERAAVAQRARSNAEVIGQCMRHALAKLYAAKYGS